MSLSVRSRSPGISSWAQDQESGGLGGEEGGGETDRQTEEEGKKERGGEESFLQQLMARQTGPVPRNTHFTLQMAPKTEGTGKHSEGAMGDKGQ